MKKFFLIISILAVSILIIGLSLTFCEKLSSSSNEKAHADKEGRYLTIINNTNQVINDACVMVGDGTEIESTRRENPDAHSFSVEIPKAFNEYDVFIVSLTDVYGMKYEKEISGVAITGRTEVVLTEDDYVQQRGDFKRKIDKFFNGEL